MATESKFARTPIQRVEVVTEADPADAPSPPADAPVAPPPKKIIPRKASFREASERRREVRRLRFMGKGYAEIAKEVGISVNKVREDLEVIARESRELVTRADSDKNVGEAMAVLDAIIECAWQDYNYALAGTKTRLDALALIKATTVEKLKAQVDVGLVRRAVEEVKVTHRVELPWTDEVKNKVIETLLQEKLSPKLMLPTPDPHAVPGAKPETHDIEIVEVKRPNPQPDAEPAPPVMSNPAPNMTLKDLEQQTLEKLVKAGVSADQAEAALEEAKAMAKASAKDISHKILDPNRAKS